MAARRHLTVGSSALLSLTALVIWLLFTGGVSAAPTCTGSKIVGKGSTLQATAQQSVWGPGIASACGVSELVTFNAAGSGAGLNAWNFNGTTSTDASVAFVATDAAPTATQIANAETSAAGAKVLAIPVAQTAIAAVVNPPSGCEIDRITNKQLESVFKGNAKTWGGLDTASGAGCTAAPITRIVRPSGSGTSYQFKNYLFNINSASLACTSPAQTWSGLKPIGAEEKPNTVWPVNSVGGCGTGTLSPLKTSGETAGLGSGGADLVKKVNITDGSIGYAALPDVEANKGIAGEFANPSGDTHWLKLQNNGLVILANATFADPSVVSNQSANCLSARYTVPVGARSSGSGESVDWSGVFGASLKIGAEEYPLCGLTYDLAFNGYAKTAGFTSGQVATVKDYLAEYVTAEAGQSALANSKKWYAALPKSGTTAFDVLSAAQLTASKIGFVNGPPCTGSKIVGKGSTLQATAQQSVWGPGIASACGVSELVTFNAAGSGAGLNAWNFNGTTSTDASVAFVATDAAPTATQIANAETSAAGAKVLAIPVAQTAIAAVVNPPSGCEIDRITNKQLESVFKGNAKTWGGLDTASGAGCTAAPITRIVRPSGSGTSYQFKNYLFNINSASLACTSPAQTWSGLKPIGAEEKPNTVWPVNSVGGCGTGTLSPLKTSGETAGLGSGGADLVKKVNITDGSIGYAALPDVEANKGIAGEFANPSGDTHWLKLQNNGLVILANATFADPSVVSNQSANCLSARYTVPVGARSSGSGESVDWSGVFGGDPKIGAEEYPLCGLSYDIALNGYSNKAGFTSGQVATVKDYLAEYVTAEAGQSALANSKKWYTALPKTVPSNTDVRSAAQLAASKIGFVLVVPSPTFTSTSPTSPGTSVNPLVKGNAVPGSTVKLYANSACSGSPVSSGSAASFGSPGIAATVEELSTTTFYATATSGEQTSACSISSITYVNKIVAKPNLVWTDPESPGKKTSIHVGGSAEAGTTVKLYPTGSCTGSPLTGTAAQLASPGLAATVSKNTTSTFSATAADGGGNVSACSSPITYVEASEQILFEAQHLADFEKIEECTSERTTEVPDPLGSGRTVLGFTVYNTDVSGPGCPHVPGPPAGSPDPRAQGLSPAEVEEGAEFWLRAKILIPSTYPTLPGGGGFLTMIGLFGPPFEGSSPWRFEAQGANFLYERNSTYGDTPWKAPLEKGKWVEIMLHERFAEGKNGWIEFWFNGNQVTFFKPGSSENPNEEEPTQKLFMATRDASNNGGANSFRMAQYRKAGMFEVGTLYFQFMKVGKTKASVGG